MAHWLSRLASVSVPVLLGIATGCGGAGGDPGARGEGVAQTSEAVTAQSIASLALANVGVKACATNSLGGHSFDSSCTGNGGQPEYWCADFARWVWANAGASNTGELTAAAGSFYVYGQNHGTLKNTPAVGDAVVFDYQGGGVADHVALVTQVNSNGTIETVSGDWGGQSGTEAQFSSTSNTVLNAPAYGAGVGSTPGIMGMTISGFISAVGVTANAPYGATFVSQSFPYASTKMTMFAGQTLKASIKMKNAGSKTWNSSTRLATSNPRDRKSSFADSTWVSPNRLAQVSGSVATGGEYSFDFVFHAPSKTGSYLEYFNLVQEGVAWFSDPGQGGPPDNDLEANIDVVPGVRGSLDSADCTAIKGWTQDQAVATKSIPVDLYFDIPEGKPGAKATRVTANVNRADLCKAIGSCVHGFSVPLPAALYDGRPHEVYAYGIAATGAGPDEQLTNAPRSITCAPSTMPPATGDDDEAGAPPSGDTDAGDLGEAGPGAGSDAGSSSDGATPGSTGGCAVSRGPVSAGLGAWATALGLALALGRRRRA